MNYSVSLCNQHIIFPEITVQTEVHPNSQAFLATLIQLAVPLLRKMPDGRFTDYENKLTLTVHEWHPQSMVHPQKRIAKNAKP